MKKIVFCLSLLCTFSANADDLNWSYFDASYHVIINDLSETIGRPGILTGISDISYVYDLNLRKLTLEMQEWLSDGLGYDVPAEHMSVVYYDNLSLSDFDKVLTFNNYDNTSLVLSSFRSQAISDVNNIRNNVVNSLNMTDLDSVVLDMVTTSVVDDIFNGDNMAAPEISYDFEHHLNIIKNSDDIASEITRAVGAESILQSNINSEVTARSEADDVLSANITNNSNAILSEKNRAMDAESILQLNINSEAIARGEEDDLLSERITTNKNTIGNVSELSGAHLNTGESVAMNLQTLNNGLVSETQNRINGDTLTLETAKTYADYGDAFTLGTSKTYTDTRIEKLDKELSSGVASAIALSSVASNGVKQGKLAISGGYGYYNGQSAGAFGLAMGLSNNWSVHAGAGVSGSNVSFRAGTSYEISLW